MWPCFDLRIAEFTGYLEKPTRGRTARCWMDETVWSFSLPFIWISSIQILNSDLPLGVLRQSAYHFSMTCTNDFYRNANIKKHRWIFVNAFTFMLLRIIAWQNTLIGNQNWSARAHLMLNWSKRKCAMQEWKCISTIWLCFTQFVKINTITGICIKINARDKLKGECT